MAKRTIDSTFAIIDVKRGRAALSRHFKGTPRMGRCPVKFRIPVTVTGYLDGQWGRDDGVSVEFSMTVQKITTA